MREYHDVGSWWGDYQQSKDVVPHAITGYENFEVPIGERYAQLAAKMKKAIERRSYGVEMDYCSDPVRYAQTLYLRRIFGQLEGRYPPQSDVVYRILGRHPFDKESGDDRPGEGRERVIRAEPPSNWRNYFSSSDNWVFWNKNPEAFEGYRRSYVWEEDRNV